MLHYPPQRFPERAISKSFLPCPTFQHEHFYLHDSFIRLSSCPLQLVTRFSLVVNHNPLLHVRCEPQAVSTGDTAQNPDLPAHSTIFQHFATAMDRSVRSSSAPLFGSRVVNGDAVLSCASASRDSEMPRLKHTPRSPGFLKHDSSRGWVEFQDSKRSMDELKEFVRTTEPDRLAPQPIFDRTSLIGLSRADSGRRRRILEHIAGSGSLPSKPLKRLFGLSRSVTTSDLTRDNIPRGSIEVAAKESKGGRKYMKIALNPKLYESENPSTYQVNFVKAKRKTPRWIHCKPQARMKIESDTSDGSGQASPLLKDNDEYCKRVMNEYPHLIVGSEISEPAKTVTKGTSNGHSPSKGIPNIRESAAATLAIAQAHACSQSRPVSTLPDKKTSPSRKHESPVRKQGNHVAHWRASSKGPYSVPIKFQMRPQRYSLPKTPRTSLDEPAALKDISPIVNGKPQAPSTNSGSDSVQSDFESAEIMNAQSAEFYQGQGTFGYHKRKPPKPGPAPTRALPSLPEGHDGGTPRSIKVDSSVPSAVGSQPVPGTSPKAKLPRSPQKGHRYRLSPVKNNVPRDACVRYELKPAAEVTESFPQPPRSLTPASPGKSSLAASPRRNREADVADVTAGRQVEASSFRDEATSTQHGDLPKAPNVPNNSPVATTTSTLECAETSIQHSTDAEKDNLDIPWQESRVERVKALKARDIERLRQRNAVDQEPNNGQDFASNDIASNHDVAVSPKTAKCPSLLPSPIQNPKASHPQKHIVPSERKDDSILSTKNAISPIVLVAEQPPQNPHHRSPTPNSIAYSTTSNSQRHSHSDHLLIPQPLSTPNGISHAQQLSLAPYLRVNRTPSPTANPSRHSHSSTTTIPASSDAEARLAALEKRCRLLEKAFLAVVEASAAMAPMTETAFLDQVGPNLHTDNGDGDGYAVLGGNGEVVAGRKQDEEKQSTEEGKEKEREKGREGLGTLRGVETSLRDA
ncbi:MAG: hypothetical protein Q9181_002816 [Wetmoreana brouardii]